jgi:hypothetical protein
MTATRQLILLFLLAACGCQAVRQPVPATHRAAAVVHTPFNPPPTFPISLGITKLYAGIPDGTRISILSSATVDFRNAIVIWKGVMQKPDGTLTLTNQGPIHFYKLARN